MTIHGLPARRRPLRNATSVVSACMRRASSSVNRPPPPARAPPFDPKACAILNCYRPDRHYSERGTCSTAPTIIYCSFFGCLQYYLVNTAHDGECGRSRRRCSRDRGGEFGDIIARSKKATGRVVLSVPFFTARPKRRYCGISGCSNQVCPSRPRPRTRNDDCFCCVVVNSNLLCFLATIREQAISQ